MRVGDVAGRLGLSLRQIDHWGRQGYVRVPSNGSGRLREIEDSEFEVIRLISVLHDAGFTVAAAARIARRYTNAGPDLAALKLSPQVTLTIERN